MYDPVRVFTAMLASLALIFAIGVVAYVALSITHNGAAVRTVASILLGELAAVTSFSGMLGMARDREDVRLAMAISLYTGAVTAGFAYLGTVTHDAVPLVAAACAAAASAAYIVFIERAGRVRRRLPAERGERTS